MSVPEVAEWLQREHGVTISERQLRRNLAQVREARGDVAKAVVRTELTKTLVGDLQRLSEICVELKERKERIAGSEDRSDRLEWERLTALEIKTIDRRLHYSGADAEESKADDRKRPQLQVFIPAEADS
jgi:uncharacterized membrane protein YccC